MSRIGLLDCLSTESSLPGSVNKSRSLSELLPCRSNINLQTVHACSLQYYRLNANEPFPCCCRARDGSKLLPKLRVFNSQQQGGIWLVEEGGTWARSLGAASHNVWAENSGRAP